MKTYDPAEIHMELNNVPITGYADGTFVTVTPSSALYTKKVGAGGEAGRARMRDESATVKFSLLATDPCNDLLSALVIKDKRDNSGGGTFQLADALGTTLITAPDAYVSKLPEVTFEKEIGVREWEVELLRADWFIGGTNG